MTRNVILCADDFGQSAAISEGILRLVDTGRLSAVSAFSQSPHWPEAGRRLLAYPVDLGLHFNLTHPFTAMARPLSYWLVRSRLPGLSRQELLAEFLRQIDAFADIVGALPDFIDGHQHVHALPVVRDALSDAIALRWTGRDGPRLRPGPYVRAPDALAHGGDSPFKAGILAWACRGFKAHLRTNGLQYPEWFGGLYSLHASADFPALLAMWLDACPERGLLMCHPGMTDDDDSDPIAAARQREYAYLAGDSFVELCRAGDIRLARFTR